MKKMLTLLAIAFTAVSAFAAQLNWSSWGYINDGQDDSDWISGGQAYLIQVNDTTNFAVNSSLAITGGSIVNSANFSNGTIYGGWTTESLVGGETYYFAILMTTDGVAGTTLPTTGSYALDLNGGTGGTYYSVVWDAANGVTLEADGNFAGATINQAVTVPEPTALALLALGVAGLALRRRA